MRIYRRLRRDGRPPGDARLYAVFCVLGKLPAMAGQSGYWLNRLRGRRSTLIEYKRAADAGEVRDAAGAAPHSTGGTPS
jgi:hypothetical protein